MPLFFSQTPNEEFSEEEKEESEEEEELVNEEEEEEEEQVEDETDSQSSVLYPELSAAEREDRFQFVSRCREIFLGEWLSQDGDWLSKLEQPQLDFLRDVLGIPSLNCYSPRTYPAYQP